MLFIESVSECITACVTYETSQCIERHYSNVCIYTLIFLYPLNNLQVSLLRRTLLISGILIVCLVYYFINFSAPIASQTLHISSNHSQPEKQHSGIGSNTTNSSEPKKPEKVRSGNGYMFALGYSDQGTGSFTNLMSFLCLAGKLGGIRIVEPFMVGSFLGINVSKNWREEVKFGDLFDAGVANRYAKKNHFSELVPFEEFLEDAPASCWLCSTGVFPVICRVATPERWKREEFLQMNMALRQSGKFAWITKKVEKRNSEILRNRYTICMTGLN